ncbi:uncharacterized protein LOC135489764 [Lineus longissimus]|uniref:uncharacterized protein LOC135489764 n=1 Tax=Lineus longissimus TaxID=88925 RepID=UPI002B4E979A
MINRNKTMSAWFGQKSALEQERLLKLSAQKAGKLRKKHIQEEKEFIMKGKERLEMARQDIEAKRLKLTVQKANITATVKENGGPCLKPRDEDALVRRFDRVTARKAALNPGVKHPSLKTSRLTCDVIVKNLKAFLLQLQIEDKNDESGATTPTTAHGGSNHHKLCVLVF